MLLSSLIPLACYPGYGVPYEAWQPSCWLAAIWHDNVYVVGQVLKLQKAKEKGPAK